MTGKVHLEKNLRARALQLLRSGDPNLTVDLGKADLPKVLEELRIYQIELELQNEDLRRSQEELQVSRRQYSDLFEFAPIGYLVLTAEGMIEQVNQTLCRLLGCDKQELHNRPLDRFVQSADHAVLYRFLRRINSGKTDEVADVILQRKSGKTFAARLVGDSPVSHDSRFGPRIRVAVMDITMQKRLEEDLLQSRKLEAVGRLSGGIAHDFNNILNAVQGYAELLQLEVEPASDARTYLDHLLASVQRAINLVQQMLAVGRNRFGQQKKIVLPQQLVQEGYERLRHTVPENVRVNLRIDKDCPAIQADSGQYFQVLLNLFTNAIDALGDRGGTISISLTRIHLSSDEMFNGSVRDSGDYVELAVGDSGEGMSQATLDRIYDPYFTTKNVGEGAGLGLAVVDGIVASHGGFITVDSTPHHGSCFKVYLPAAGDGGQYSL